MSESAFDDLATSAPAGPSPDELCRYDLNDFGNAMRLIRLAGGRIGDDGEVELAAAELLYLEEHGWIGFNGRRWDLKHGERLAQRLAHKVASGLWAQAVVYAERRMERKRLKAEAEGSDDDKKKANALKPEIEGADFFAFAEQSGNAGRTASMLKQAMGYLSVDLEVFDRDKLALNVRNGTLKLRKRDGKMRIQFAAHSPADRITRLADVDYDADAKAPLWQASLKAWLPLDPVRAFVQRAAGYAATGVTYEQVFFIFQGLGRDGKSTFVGALRETLGDYGATSDVKTFLDIGQRSGADANPDVARMAGDTRLISVAEPPRGAKLAEAMIKSFTGGAPILARRLRMDPFEFQPIGKVVMECNSRPVIRGDDEGIWRRIILVLWENQVPKDDVDRELPRKLANERSGILNWVLEGVGDWLSQGLKPPDRVNQALEDYRKGSSPFAEWMLERLVIDKAEKTVASILFHDFKHWMEERDPDAKVMSQRAFGLALADRQIIQAGKNGDGKVVRQGARLKTAAELFEDRREPSPLAASATRGVGASAAADGGVVFGFDADDASPFDG